MAGASLIVGVLAGCPQGISPCDDTGPASGGSPWLVVLVVAAAIAAVACLVAVIAYLWARRTG